MANSFEGGMAHAMKGLSFFDWDGLDNDEYDKLSKIISTSNKSAGVQLLFEDDEESDNCEEGSSGNTEEVLDGTCDYEEVKDSGVVDVENSILQPAAPVFQPSIPPPSIMPIPIAVPHWPHADHNMPPPQAQAPQYTYPVPGGYVFHHDPNLAVHNGEVTMAFVTLSNGQPAYAFPGHPIPAHHFHQPTTIASGIPPLPNAAAATHFTPQGDVLLHPVSGAVIPTTMSHHPLVFPPHIATTMGQPLPAHMVPPNTVAQHMPHNQHQHSTQFIYIPQMPPVSNTQTRDIISNEACNEHILNHSAHEEKVEEVEEEKPSSNKATPVLNTSPSKPGLSEIEFGGPVVFETEPSVPVSSPSQQIPLNSTVKDGAKQSPPPVKATTDKETKATTAKETKATVASEKINNATAKEISRPQLDLPSRNKDKTDNKVAENVPQSTSQIKKKTEPVNTQEHSVNSKLSSPNVNEPQISNVKSSPSSPSSSSSPSSVNTTPHSPIVNSTPKEDNSPKPDSKSTSNVKESTMDADHKPQPAPAAPVPATKTWSSLFGKPSQNPPSNVSSSVISNPSSDQVTANKQSPPNSSAESGPKGVQYWQELDKKRGREMSEMASNKPIKAIDVRQDPLAPKLLAKLSDFPISHIPIIVQPRGLKNGNNICFMNATLQVLMGCPPFIHLFRAFRNLPARSGGNSSTPVFDALVQFVNSFQNCQRVRNQAAAKNKKGNVYDINVGVPFIPESLLTVAQHILGLKIGVQHDAEEFLSQILSICNEEVEKIIKMKNMDSLNNNNTSTSFSGKKNGNVRSIHQNGDVNGESNNHQLDDGEDDGDDSWVQVGPKHHCVETNVNNCGQTPLSAIFAGLSRCCLVRESGKTSDTVDSFFTLKLDIQADSIHSVKDALVRLNATEDVHDVDGRKVNGHRRMFFDVLPPVLIMHLKLFEYSNGNGQKIQKNIAFDVDLQIPKEIMSRVGKSKYPALKSRSYKLFGVVNHHGTKMNDGHYTSDVFLPIVNGWLHFDDSDVTLNDEPTVLQYMDKRMPYLLFYRRMDV